MEPIVSRKKKQLDHTETFKNSDFNKRHGKKMSKSLKDIKYEGEFSLTDRLTYEDDPQEQLYEIIYKDRSPYLVFQVSFVRVSMSYDDDLMFEEIPVSLAIYPEQHLFSTFDPFTHKLVSIVSAVTVIGVFLTISYQCILPAHVKKQIFGF